MKKIITLTICFIFSSSAFASYKEALTLYEAKNYAASLKIIAAELDAKKDLDSNSQNYDYRYLAAHNHWRLGNIQPAIAHLKRCADIRKDSPDPLLDISFILFDSKRYGDVNFYAAAALKKKETPLAYYVLGKSAMKAGNYAKAKEFFEKAVLIDPEFGISYNYLGMTLMELRKYGEANTAFSAAMATMSGSAEVLNNIGVSLEASNKLTESLFYLNKALEKNPENASIKANIARVNSKINTPKK